MVGEVLRMNIITIFELWCFVSTVVLPCRHYAKLPNRYLRAHNPQKVYNNLEFVLTD